MTRSADEEEAAIEIRDLSSSSALTPAQTGFEQPPIPISATNGNNEAAADEDDDDNVTVILLDPDEYDNVISIDWVNQPGPEMEERRRNVLIRELQRVQRASCLHFAVLCLIPAALLLVVLLALVSGEEDCTSDVTHCELETRTFVNAFTTRCVCEPVPVLRTWDDDPLF